MIPKIIHYCWLSGDPYPSKIQHCIDSWKKIIPDYKLVLWDANKFPVEDIPWVKEAFREKRYAFAADYIRLYAVYNYGGIYLDSDVEVLKSFDDLLNLPYFIGRESMKDRVEVAAFGAEKGCPWVKKCLDYYEGRHFVKFDGTLDKKVMPDIVYDELSSDYKFNYIQNISEYCNNDKTINVFPKDWFCANVHLNPNDPKPTYIISDNTYCVHHFANSWIKADSFQLRIKRILHKFGL